MNDYLTPQQNTAPFPQTFTVDPTTGALVPSGQQLPGVYTITAPDGTVRHVYGPGGGAAPVLLQNTPLPLAEATGPRPALVHPWLVNAVVGAAALVGIVFALQMLIGFMAALAHLLMTLVILVAVLAGAVVALRLMVGAPRNTGRGTTVNIKKAVFKRNTFRG
jgi:hypothetical protein